MHRRRPLTGRQWKLALATGLVAFAAAAGVVTASELLAGGAVRADSGRTTLFGGGSAKQSRADKQDDRRASRTTSRQGEGDADPDADAERDGDADRHVEPERLAPTHARADHGPRVAPPAEPTPVP